MAITLLITGPDLVPISDPITTWTSITAEVKHNEVGGGEFTVPADDDMSAILATPGARVKLIRNGSVFSAGPIEKSVYDWDAKSGTGPTVCQWADDLVYVARRDIYPDPAVAATAQVVEAYTATATNAEMIIRDIVNRNVGPGSLPDRVEPYLVMGPVMGVGTSVDFTARFDKAMDKIRDLCVAGGNLGVRVTESSDGLLVFGAYAPIDRSDAVRFSDGLHNLLSLKLTHEAPIATVAIAGGGGTGAARVFVERVNTDGLAWGRSEIVVSDTQATTTDGLNQAGDKALADNGEHYVVEAKAVDTPDQRFGIHVNISDIVSLTSPMGVTVTDMVMGAKLTATPTGGDLVEMSIGSNRNAGVDPQIRWLRNLEKRVGAMERI
jgi:hypothetical protein